MDQNVTAPRIRRPSADEALVKELTSDPNAPFTTIRELLVFSAALAFAREASPRPFDKSSEPIPYQIFENAQLDKFIDMLALVVTGDHNVLGHEKLPQRIAIFEEMAASGLNLLQRELSAARARWPGDVLRDLVLDQFKDQQQQGDTKLDHLLAELEG